MKKALANTRVTVKLRKSEYHDEWYLYIEAYPVFQSGKDKPQRLREYLNRTITTPVFDSPEMPELVQMAKLHTSPNEI